MSFRTALTGLNAATTDLGVIAHNISNNETAGFKASRTEFAELFSQGTAGAASHRAPGIGVRVATIAQQFQQGNINTTGNTLDLAVDGQGFFRLSDSGATVYSRNGSFGLDREGYVVNKVGQRLTGYQADAAGTVGDTLGDLQLSTAQVDPKGTSRASLGLNLDSAAAGIDATALPFNPVDPNTYQHSTSLNIHDSQGTPHLLGLYFARDATESSRWNVYATLDGDTTAVSGLAPASVSFDASGKPTGTTELELSLADLPGSTAVFPGDATAVPPVTAGSVRLDFSEITQFGSAFATHALGQDGYTTGTLAGVSVGEDGVISGSYTNGQTRALGQVALVSFRNPQGLRAVGDTAWAENHASGQPVVGEPGTSSLGGVRSGALEGSNVELTEQLVEMINAQRNFQANAQVISTNDAMTQTIINLR